MYNDYFECKFALLEETIDLIEGDGENGCIFFHFDLLDSLDSHGYHRGDWVNLNLIDNVNHLAKICYIRQSVNYADDRDRAFISPLLYYNLLGPDKHIDASIMSSTLLKVNRIFFPFSFYF